MSIAEIEEAIPTLSLARKDRLVALLAYLYAKRENPASSGDQSVPWSDVRSEFLDLDETYDAWRDLRDDPPLPSS